MACCRHWSRRPWRGAWPLGLSEHLGYDKGEPTSQARGNARNGTTSKTVDSEVGPFETCGAPGPGRDLHPAPGAQRGIAPGLMG